MNEVKTCVDARARSLDGLRGVAAIVVLLGHVLNYTPVMDHVGFLHAGGGARWWVNTPVQMIFDGPDAVLVFFVLSGFVLLPTVARTRPGWVAYYPSRVLRLMLPAMASVVLALAVLRFSDPWVTVTTRSVTRDLVLVTGTDGLNGPLWSLQWELWFSLALPLYVLLARWRPRSPAKTGAVLAVALAGLLTGESAVFYLSVFAIGSLLAVEYRRGTTARFVTAIKARRGGMLGFVVIVVLAFNARALLAFPGEPGLLALQLSGIPVLLGAVGVVVLALHAAPFRRALERPLAQWVGRCSFSIYLVHWPLVEFVHSHGGDTLGGWTTLIAVALSLAVGAAFHSIVERPAHQLARRTNAAVARRLACADSPSMYAAGAR